MGGLPAAHLVMPRVGEGGVEERGSYLLVVDSLGGAFDAAIAFSPEVIS